MAYKCGRRKQSCRGCGHRFPKTEYDLWNCPKCETHRGCTQRVKNEGDACHFHGGKSLKGTEHPNYQGKGFSIYMPRDWLATFENFRTTPKELSLHDMIDVAKTILAEQLKKLDRLSTIDAWSRAHKTYVKMKKALDREDAETANRLLWELEVILEEGAGVREQVEAVLKTVETIRKLQDTQRQMYETKRHMVPIAWIVPILMQISEVLNEEFAPLEGSTGPLKRVRSILRTVFGKLPVRKS